MQYLTAVFFRDNVFNYAIVYDDRTDYVPASMRWTDHNGCLHLWAPTYVLKPTKGKPTQEDILQAVLEYHETLKVDNCNPVAYKAYSETWLSTYINIHDPFQTECKITTPKELLALLEYM